MPTIRPISDLRNNANEISDFCRQTHEPVYITRNGSGRSSTFTESWPWRSRRYPPARRGKISLQWPVS